MVRGARHRIVIVTDPEVTASDAQGYAVVGNAASVFVDGSLDFLSANERLRAQAFAPQALAAARVPHGTAVDYRAKVKLVDGGGMPSDPELEGFWLVAFVQHERPHLRLLLRRPEKTN